MIKRDSYSFFETGTNGKGVILVHGLTGSPAEMRFVGKQLHKAGFTVYAPTLDGHCIDEAALLATTYEDWVASLHQAIRDLQPQVNEIYMAGICVGGALALTAAQMNGANVSGVVIYSPALNYDGWNVPFYYPWAVQGIPIIRRIPLLNRISFPEHPPYGIKSDRVRNAIMNGGSGIEGTLPSFPARALYQNCRLNSALKTMLPRITTPTLLIHAMEDDVCHPRNSEKIKVLHGGTCEIMMLHDSYHMIHVDQERKKVAQATADFFNHGTIAISPLEGEPKRATRDSVGGNNNASYPSPNVAFAAFSSPSRGE